MRKTLRSIVSTGLVIVLAVPLMSCLPYPLGDPEKSQVDPALQGRWMREQDGRTSVVTVYPFDKHAYVLESRDVVRDGPWLEPKGRFLAKAWVTKVGGQTFITLDQLDQKLLPDSVKKAYPVFRLNVSADTIQIVRVNEEFAAFTQAKSSQDVERIIREELQNPDLYAEASTYRRVTAERDAELLQALSELP